MVATYSLQRTTSTPGKVEARVASNVWVPDLGSQPFARQDWQAAGGVRGLGLANYFTGANGGGIHVPGMDPMGNVTSVTRLGMSYSAGESPGPYFRSEFVYDYDAFGKETRSSTLVAGLNPDSFPFHFSTKFTDPESGFNYYGYRFYDPANGRWINRDPIGERGGVNLYEMVRNRVNSLYDILGKAEPVSLTHNATTMHDDGFRIDSEVVPSGENNVHIHDLSDGDKTNAKYTYDSKDGKWKNPKGDELPKSLRKKIAKNPNLSKAAAKGLKRACIKGGILSLLALIMGADEITQDLKDAAEKYEDASNTEETFDDQVAVLNVGRVADSIAGGTGGFVIDALMNY